MCVAPQERVSQQYQEFAQAKQSLEVEREQLREQLRLAEERAAGAERDRMENEQLRTANAVLEKELEKERESAAQRMALDKEARERHEALAAELNNMTQDLTETERDLEAEIEEKEELKKSGAAMRRQLTAYAAVVAENQSLKADQDLLTQELKRMQVRLLSPLPSPLLSSLLSPECSAAFPLPPHPQPRNPNPHGARSLCHRSRSFMCRCWVAGGGGAAASEGDSGRRANRDGRGDSEGEG